MTDDADLAERVNVCWRNLEGLRGTVKGQSYLDLKLWLKSVWGGGGLGAGKDQRPQELILLATEDNYISQ